MDCITERRFTGHISRATVESAAQHGAKSSEEGAPLLDISFPRLSLGFWPTPLQPARRLSEAIGCSVYIKRDDLTGVGGGGNKIRKLEFQLAHALAENATHIITTGSVQSNHAHLTAAAARHIGLQPVLVLSGSTGGAPHGNLLLDRLMDAEVHFVTPPPNRPPLETMNRAMDEQAYEIQRRGGHPFVVPEGGTDALGSVGYVLAVTELTAQLAALPQPAERPLVILATGTCGTHAGLLAGVRWTGADIDVLGVSISGDMAIKLHKTARVATETLQLLGTDGEITSDAVMIVDAYKGAGYGVVTPAAQAAIRLAAEAEGLFLDPVYTGKAMAALVDLARAGQLRDYDTIVFLHTGGLPLLFVPKLKVL